jgi:hypothetical protein
MGRMTKGMMKVEKSFILECLSSSGLLTVLELKQKIQEQRAKIGKDNAVDIDTVERYIDELVQQGKVSRFMDQISLV